MKKKVILVCGTRPEIIKMAPVYKALQSSNQLEPLVLHTGQHTDLATPLYEFFSMPPAQTVELVRHSPSLASLSTALLEGVTGVLEHVKPDAVLVHGDTSSAAMGALAAFYQQIPLGHVEAGLRTHDKYSPFPEEMNRSLVGRMADWHYAPTPRAAQALFAEGIPREKVLMTGNTVIDAALLTAKTLKEGYPEPFVQKEHLEQRIKGHRLVLVTAHRRENWGASLEQIAAGVADLLDAQPDLFVVWPLHANPAVAQAVRNVFSARGTSVERLLLCPPQDYSALVWLLHHAWLVLTDSGGIQEEAAAFGVPTLVLRDSTERPELIEAGGGVLVGARRELIVEWVTVLHSKEAQYLTMRNIVNPFGDGTSGEQIRAHLEKVL